MLSFESDYIQGAHPDILKRLAETNLEPLTGYGFDRYTQSAAEKIKEACKSPDADVFFLAGGTQTNLIAIDTMLKSYEGVIAADTGHIALHEAGAVEYTGHKVITVPQSNGKIDIDALADFLEMSSRDENREHMVFPGMVYISHPTEYGTLYSKEELETLSGLCRQYGMRLYMDGARLAYGLMSSGTDVTLEDIARLCDAFYIGGTKCGALCGEALVFRKGCMPPHFMTQVKQHGALAAKGRLFGVQFDTLFTNDLYFSLGKSAIEKAERMKQIFDQCGMEYFLRTPTNQQFLILDDEIRAELEKEVAFGFWEKTADGRTVVRFATGWATTDEDLDSLERIMKHVIR